MDVMNVDEGAVMSQENSPVVPGSPRGAQPWIVTLIAVVVVAAVALAGVALGHSQSSKAASPTATISVTGSGTVQGTPDTVSFEVGVQTTGSTAVHALELNNIRMRAMEKALSRHGVTKKDMQTSGLDIYANTNSSGQVTGFTASDDLSVTMHQLRDAGGAIDAAAHAVGNGIQLSGITFSISNESKLLAAARAKAMQNAYIEATQVAQGGHATVGALVKVTDQENTGSTGVVFPVYAQASATSSNVPVEAGSQSISVQVSVVYALH